MRIITSKNTWYFIFGFVLIFLISLIVYKLMFAGAKDQPNNTFNQDRNSYISATPNTASSENVLPIGSPTATSSPSASPDKTTAKTQEKNKIRAIVSFLFPTLSKTTASSSSSPSSVAVPTSSSPSPLAGPSSPPPANKSSPPTNSNKTTTTSNDLEIITTADGATFLGTKKNNGQTDNISSPRRIILAGMIFPPTGYATDLGTYINTLARFALLITALLVFIQLIWGGINWLTSGGDKTKIETARSKIMAAVIGLIIVASAYAIFGLILSGLRIGNINDLLQTSLRQTTSTKQKDKGATTSATIIIDESKSGFNTGAGMSGKTKGGL